MSKKLLTDKIAEQGLAVHTAEQPTRKPNARRQAERQTVQKLLHNF